MRTAAAIMSEACEECGQPAVCLVRETWPTGARDGALTHVPLAHFHAYCAEHEGLGDLYSCQIAFDATEEPQTGNYATN